MESTTEHLVPMEFIRYHNWANQRLLEACRGLTTAQLAASAAGTYGSIYETWVHIVRADADYTSRLVGEAPEPPFKWGDRPGISEILAYSRPVGEALSAAMSQVGPDDVV